jgi:hypothetical protein
MTKYNRLEFIKWLNSDETRKENLSDWSQNTEPDNWDNVLSNEFFNVDNWEERMKLMDSKSIPYRKVFNKWKIEKDKVIKEWEREMREEQRQKNQQEIKANLLIFFTEILSLAFIYYFFKRKFSK